MPDQKRYVRPPITEAVIELRFGETLSARDMERAQEKFKRQFVTVEERMNVELSIQGQKVTHTASPAGYKLTAKNAADVILITPNTLCTVRLAPYESWDALIELAKEHFDILVKVLGRKSVVRIGARFLNRFDVPNHLIVGADISEFLLLGISLPDSIGKTVGPYSLAVNTVHDNTGAKLLVQSAITVPALIDHTSITLDTDAFWDFDIPQRIDDMWAKAEALRAAKNSVFENSITDKLRELFK